MRKPLFLLLAAVLFACSNHQQPFYRAGAKRFCQESAKTELHYRLILLGDSGAPRIGGGEPVLDAVSESAARYPEKTVVVFLGDNIYNASITHSNPTLRKKAEKILRKQLERIKETGADAVFIPGNHDWDGQQHSVCAEAKIVEQFRNEQSADSSSSIQFAPQPCACPGPQELDFEEFRLVVMDTTWLRKENELQKVSAQCPNRNQAEVYAKLSQLLQGNKPVVLVGHHGLLSYGSHGQFYDWKDHLFPFRQGGYSNLLWIPMPGFGSLTLLLHSTLGCALDACGPMERRVVAPLRRILETDPPLIYAAGHDHSLQVLEGESLAKFLLVSGAGSPSLVNEVTDGSETLFAQSNSGFMMIDFFAEAETKLQVIGASAAETNLLYSHCFKR